MAAGDRAERGDRYADGQAESQADGRQVGRAGRLDQAI
jgi:hypothetical protein